MSTYPCASSVGAGGIGIPGASGGVAPAVAVGVDSNGDLLKDSSGETLLLDEALLLAAVSGGVDFLHAVSASIVPINAAINLTLFIESLHQ
jgi:hypothetical protein